MALYATFTYQFKNLKWRNEFFKYLISELRKTKLFTVFASRKEKCHLTNKIKKFPKTISPYQPNPKHLHIKYQNLIIFLFNKIFLKPGTHNSEPFPIIWFVYFYRFFWEKLINYKKQLLNAEYFENHNSFGGYYSFYHIYIINESV